MLWSEAKRKYDEYVTWCMPAAMRPMSFMTWARREKIDITSLATGDVKHKKVIARKKKHNRNL